MPFDAASYVSPLSYVQLARDRRERAGALWCSLRDDQLDLGSWFNSCGTAACALGWLGARQFDGWRNGEIRPTWRWDDAPELSPVFESVNHLKNDPFAQAGFYFGLRRVESLALFQGEQTYHLYGVTDLREAVRPRDVAELLAAMPVRDLPDVIGSLTGCYVAQAENVVRRAAVKVIAQRSRRATLVAAS